MRILLVCFVLISTIGYSQSEADLRLQEIATAPSADRLEHDIRKLANFGTRHTLSDTVSETRGIGAARRWIKAAFETISENCDNCLEVSYNSEVVKADGRRIVHDTKIVNVVAVQRGTKYPNKYVIMSGDIDSRISDSNNFTDDSPGANDNASGMAGALEAARVLSKYSFPVSIIYVGLSGEEQGLFGGKILAEHAKKNNWNIIGVLNNDMIGNIHGIDGVIDNTSFRVFSEAISMDATDRQKAMMRYYGGEVDGPSRQLARYIDTLTDAYMTNLDAIMIYRLDRFGRGGHHRPFNDAGFTGVRIMETHENYNRQHQDIRTENGIAYGDVIEGVDFDYASKLTAVNCLTLAALAMAPVAPQNVKIAGAVQPSTRLKWDASTDANIVGYKVYWRNTTSAQWEYSRFVGNINDFTLENIVIDNFLFGVASIGKNGAESLVAFPYGLIPRGE
ncbi:M28 family metallopeptidase [Urechidicola vernalis]|uniref:M28 family metallopeptidase n=1 Tax=Urechidicola vernalis TaxID=3075600 RepID=A0ABU2Y0T4_9FLAO|nr:M28 family metallopeptidase [Urechidicola sp. P050]MDT0551716.1 M28 family metallopeptidase [Urechidicola sp. P050]